MKIERIYVAGFKHDVQFTRTCVASIRAYYPAVPITLIKDRFYGDYSTREIERHFGCAEFENRHACYGWGFGKLEPLFLPHRERFLVLDSDTVFVGRVLDRLEQFDADFVVQLEQPTPEFVASHYFDLRSLEAIDPAFRFPGYTFNTGQWVGTSGLLHRSEFDSFVHPTEPPRLKHNSTFKLGEQGLLNYVLMKMKAADRITLERDRFMEVGDNPAVIDLDTAQLGAQSPYRFLIHWCGLRKPTFRQMVRGDILEHFNRLYYQRVPLGGFWRAMRPLVEAIMERSRKIVRTCRQLFSSVWFAR